MYKMGDRIEYVYSHPMSGDRVIRKAKKGKFIRYCRSRLGKGDMFPMAIVHLEGNANPTRVSTRRLFRA